MTASERTVVSQKYKEKIPAPLNTQFPDRVSKAEAVANSKKRKQQQTPLYPSGIIAKISEAAVICCTVCLLWKNINYFPLFKLLCTKTTKFKILLQLKIRKPFDHLTLRTLTRQKKGNRTTLNNHEDLNVENVGLTWRDTQRKIAIMVATVLDKPY